MLNGVCVSNSNLEWICRPLHQAVPWLDPTVPLVGVAALAIAFGVFLVTFLWHLYDSRRRRRDTVR